MKTVFLSALMLLSSISFSTNNEREVVLRLRHFNLKRHVAIKQYDPVAYFTAGKAVKGNEQYVASYQGVTYYFSSSANKTTFLSSPSQYEPAYGGWCAYAMGHHGGKEDTNPETFKIIDGRLFLFYNKWGRNDLPEWEKNEQQLIADADKHWANIYR